MAPEVIVSAGTTGGLGRDVEVGDVCACTSTAYNDVDATAFGYALGQTPGQPPAFTADAGLVARVREVGQVALGAATATSGSSRVHVGQMLSGGSFVTAANVGATRELFPQAVSTDMETTAVAQVARAHATPFLSVRGVSDLCGPEAGQEFHISSDEAAARSPLCPHRKRDIAASNRQQPHSRLKMKESQYFAIQLKSSARVDPLPAIITAFILNKLPFIDFIAA